MKIIVDNILLNFLKEVTKVSKYHDNKAGGK